MVERRIKTALITGPTGTIGTALCRRLLDEGMTVYAVIRPRSPRVIALPHHDRLRVVECDASDYQRLPKLVERADAFFHFAWADTIGPGRNDMPAQIRNIQNTIEAVRAAAAIGCQVFIGAGSQAEYGRVDGVLRAETPVHPENGYGMAKLCAGQMSRLECHRLGLDHIWARVLSVYGPGDGAMTMITGTIQKLLAGEKPALTQGVQKWDYLFSEDAAQAFYLMALRGQNGAVYPLGSGQAKPLKEYIGQLRDTIDPGLPLGLGEIPYGPLQVMHLEADISQLQSDTGFRPITDFSEGIKKTVDWVRSNQK